MRTVLEPARLHDWPGRPGYWRVTVGGIPCGYVYQRASAFGASSPVGQHGEFPTREQAAAWLAEQEVGR